MMEVLAFSGHGVFEHAAGYHGSLVCSFNRRVSAATIDNIAVEERFNGTIVRILNMCDASADTVPSNASIEPIGRAQRDVAALQRLPREALATIKGVIISASSPFTMAYGNSTGSYMIKALGALFAKVPVVTYECVASLLNSGRVGSKLVDMGALNSGIDALAVVALDEKLQGCCVSMTPGLCGVFGCPAFQVNGVLDCTFTHASESDDEF